MNSNMDYYRDTQSLPYYLQMEANSSKPSIKSFENFYKAYINNDVSENKDKDYEREFYKFLKERVSDFIGKSPYDHIVLLLGAGASVVEIENNGKSLIDKRYGKTMGQLAWNIFSSISKKEYVNEINAKSEVLLTYKEIVKFLSDNKSEKFPEPKNDSVKWKDTFPLEELISQMDFYIKGNEHLIELSEDNKKKKHFYKVCNTKNYIIYKIFKAVNYDNLDDEKIPFNHMSVVLALTGLLRDLSEKLTIVTTNYDLAIEKSLGKRDFSIFNGFNLSNDSVFDESSFDWVLSKKVNHINTHEVIYKPNMVNLFKIHGSIDWLFDGERTRKVSVEEVKQNLISQIKLEDNFEKSLSDKRNEVRMIFPSTNKYMQSYEEPYFDLMARFQEELHKTNTLLVTSGFSFGDDHISRMVINAIKHNSSLKCLFTDYEIHNSKFYKYIEAEDSEKIDNDQETKEKANDMETISIENLYGNKNWRELDELRNEGYDIAFLKATMNDKKNGLAFFLRG